MFYKRIGSLNFPLVGVGTYGIPVSSMESILQTALSYGASYIDSAYRYDNESVIGSCIQENNIRREDLILGTKLSYDQQISGTVEEALNASLQNLKTDYIDVYFIHSAKSATYCKDFAEMLKIRETGKIREAAVSNFGPDELTEIFDATGVYPSINQIEIHIGCYPQKTVSFCKEHGIAVQASCPLMRMSDRITGNTHILEMENKYGRSFSQISLRWLFQHEIFSIPRTQDPAHMAENMDIFDFVIDEEDMRTIDSITV